jgi:CheY-like chemotaxis protein
MRNVLVVDDEAAVLGLIKLTLERAGYNVIPAAGPQEALAVEGEYDLAVVDVLMPGMNGVALVERIRQQRPSLKVLYVSGYIGNATIPEGEAFLGKPFRLEALQGKVEALLAPADRQDASQAAVAKCR